MAPTLSAKDLSLPTFASDKGSHTFPTASASGTLSIDGTARLDSLGFISQYLSDFRLLILVIISIYLFGFQKFDSLIFKFMNEGSFLGGVRYVLLSKALLIKFIAYKFWSLRDVLTFFDFQVLIFKICG